MGKWEETEEAYHGRENPEEKVIPEKDKMGLVQALMIHNVQLMDCLGYLKAMCRSNAKCSTCLLYDEDEKETACLLCKAEGNSLADNIVDAYAKIRRNNGSQRSRQ